MDAELAHSEKSLQHDHIANLYNRVIDKCVFDLTTVHFEGLTVNLLLLLAHLQFHIFKVAHRKTLDLHILLGAPNDDILLLRLGRGVLGHEAQKSTVIRHLVVHRGTG